MDQVSKKLGLPAWLLRMSPTLGISVHDYLHLRVYLLARAASRSAGLHRTHINWLLYLYRHCRHVNTLLGSFARREATVEVIVFSPLELRQRFSKTAIIHIGLMGGYRRSPVTIDSLLW